MIFGIAYPDDQYWRPILSFDLLFVCVAPVLFASLPRKLLIASAIYPFLAYWLVWGGTIMIPIMVMVGFIAGYYAFTWAERASGFAAGLGAFVVTAAVVWFIGGMVSGAMPGFIALEEVPSRDMGGFMLNMILGTICLAVAAFGYRPRTGRGPDANHQGICVVFIEFIRGVPLITLLFVANVVWPMPPGTNLDLICG